MNDAQAQYIAARIVHAKNVITFTILVSAGLVILALGDGTTSLVLGVGAMLLAFEAASIGFAQMFDGWNRKLWGAINSDHAPYLDVWKEEVEGDVE